MLQVLLSLDTIDMEQVHIYREQKYRLLHATRTEYKMISTMHIDNVVSLFGEEVAKGLDEYKEINIETNPVVLNPA